MENLEKYKKIEGMLIGVAVGDSLGLPMENINSKIIQELIQNKWEQRLLIKYGMISDDTEHTIFVAKSLLKYPDSHIKFIKELSWYFRIWLMLLPASIGYSTLKAIIKLWLGISPLKSGVYSAGNGPAMRISPISAVFYNNKEKLDNYIEVCTKITHLDQRALIGAKAIAYLIAWILRENIKERPPLEKLIEILNNINPKNKEWEDIVLKIHKNLKENKSEKEFVKNLGIKDKVTGYIFHTVPVVIFCWYRNFENFEKALISILNLGGDTDTTGSILGALCGVSTGIEKIPQKWINKIIDYPNSIKFIKKIAYEIYKLSENIENKKSIKIKKMNFWYYWILLGIRNIFFILIILIHGLIRLITLNYYIIILLKKLMKLKKNNK